MLFFIVAEIITFINFKILYLNLIAVKLNAVLMK